MTMTMTTIIRNAGDEGWSATTWQSEKMPHFDHDNTFDLQANKDRVLRLIADIFASGESNDMKERKLGDIIDDLETARRRLAQQKAAALKVSPVSLVMTNVLLVAYKYTILTVMAPSNLNRFSKFFRRLILS